MLKATRTKWLLTVLVGMGFCLFQYAGTTSRLPDQVMMSAVEGTKAGQISAVPSSQWSLGSPRSISVPLEDDDRALMLIATLDESETATFILDTGATYTSISQDLADRLGYDLRHVPRVRITTANGQVSLPKVTLKSLTLNGYTATNVEATVMALPKNIPFSGLLGLSFVKNHKITIDTEAEQLVIEPPQNP